MITLKEIQIDTKSLLHHVHTYKVTMMATERQQRMTIAAMTPSDLSSTWMQEQEEEKSKM